MTAPVSGSDEFGFMPRDVFECAAYHFDVFNIEIHEGGGCCRLANRGSIRAASTLGFDACHHCGEARIDVVKGGQK